MVPLQVLILNVVMHQAETVNQFHGGGSGQGARARGLGRIDPRRAEQTERGRMPLPPPSARGRPSASCQPSA